MQGQMPRLIMTASGNHVLQGRGFQVASPSENGKLPKLHTTCRLVLLVGFVDDSADSRTDGRANRTRNNKPRCGASGSALLHIRAASRQGCCENKRDQ